MCSRAITRILNTCDEEAFRRDSTCNAGKKIVASGRWSVVSEDVENKVVGRRRKSEEMTRSEAGDYNDDFRPPYLLPVFH
jgi:hypothetical protein